MEINNRHILMSCIGLTLVFAFVLTIMLVITEVAFGVGSYSGSCESASNTAEPGEVVVVDVVLKGAPGEAVPAGASLEIDCTHATCISVATQGSDLANMPNCVSLIQADGATVVYTYYGNDSFGGTGYPVCFDEEGKIILARLSLTAGTEDSLSVVVNADKSLYALSGDVVDYALPTGESCSISIISVTPLYGDANLDGLVNGADLTLIRRYLAELINEEDISGFENMDVNGSGSVDGADLTLYRRYLAELIDTFPVTQ